MELSLYGEEEANASTLNVLHSRLIEWNVDLLSKLLKQVVAGRSLGATSSETAPSPRVLPKRLSILKEVSESIELTKFDPRAATARAQPSSVELPEPVIEQLRQYVTIIAGKYRNNPFHNFAHASHVVMSANKLLRRIVKPAEDVNYHRTSVRAIASDLHDYTHSSR